MSMSESFVKEFTQEYAATRRLLERVPDEHFGWKPHDKSMTLGRLASHVAENAELGTWVLTMDELVLDPETYKPFEASNREDLLKMFDRNVLEARDALEEADESAFANIWRMKWGGEVVLEMPRMEVLRSFLISHLIHHRGQLTVYLRMKDVPLPQLYGPTADEQQ
jgi:uncharacterized damage-inducible protein DinB